MGFFSSVIDIYKKSEAAVVVQNLLEHQAKCGLFTLDPAKTSTKLVEDIWLSKPDIFGGKFGQRPYKITVAAIALANSLKLFEEHDLNRSAILLSLGNVLAEIETNGRLYPLNSLDHELIKNCSEIFQALAQNFDDPLGLAENWISSTQI